MVDIVISPPGKDAPGFLKRNKKMVAFAKQASNISDESITEEIFDEWVDFLIDYVTEPADRDEARDLLWNASENEIMQMMQAVTGTTGESDENPTEA